jgi:serine/threonine protein kinase
MIVKPAAGAALAGSPACGRGGNSVCFRTEAEIHVWRGKRCGGAVTDQYPQHRPAQGGHHFALRKGTRLHEFEIESVLGHGGFGITYRALDTALREVVAI